MTSSNESSGGNPRRRPAPMIELEASAVERPAQAEAARAADQDQSDAPGERARRSIAWLPPGGPWRLLGAAAAGAAAVLLALWLSGLLPSRDRGTGALEARLSRVEQQLREVSARAASAVERGTVDDLAGRLGRLEAALAAIRPTASDPAMANRVALVEGEVKAAAENVAMLGRRSDEIAVTAREARQRADATAATLAELGRKVDGLAAAPAGGRDLEAVSRRIAALERAERTVEAGGGDPALRLAVVAASLEAAVERGAPYAPVLAVAGRLREQAGPPLADDAAMLAPLAPFADAGVPTAPALARELVALVPALLTAAGAPPRDSLLDRLQAGAERLVRIRPVEEVAGTDAGAIIARIEAKAAQADLAGALAELRKLEPAVRAPADGWIDKAQARAAALAASRRFSATAFAALGK